MTERNLSEILKIIPSLFEINLNTDKDGRIVFDKLSEVLKFDEAFIYFINPESLQLKYSFKKHSNYNINQIFPIEASIKSKLFNKDGDILSPDSDIIKTVKKPFLII